MFHYGSGTVATARSSNFNPPARDGDGHRLSCPCRDFNPPTRKGWDLGSALPVPVLPEFQSTHPQGVGLYDAHSAAERADFNPPTRKGWDAYNYAFYWYIFDFNPPTRKGWDFFATHERSIVSISIHPPARGGTVWCSLHIQPHYDFNPPTRKGWDCFLVFLGIKV